MPVHPDCMLACLPRCSDCLRACLQVAAHPRGREKNAVGPTPPGPVLLQIWSIPTSAQPHSSNTNAADITPMQSPTHRDPRMAQAASQVSPSNGSVASSANGGGAKLEFGMALKGGVVRDCQWCPGAEQLSDNPGPTRCVSAQLCVHPSIAHCCNLYG